MDRRDFLRSACLGCTAATLGLGALSLQGCSTLPLVKVDSDGRSLRVPLTSFSEASQVLVRTPRLTYDVLAQKLPEGGYRGLYLRCSHKDQPLTATPTGLHCPSHGSRFGLDGALLEGPATEALPPLRTEANATDLIIHVSS